MNQNLATFDPDWISSPGATVLDVLTERNWSIAEFAAAVNRTSYDVAQLVTGATRLTPDWAEHLVETIGASTDFWLRREEHYRRDIARLSAVTSDDQLSTWLSELPIKDMTRNRWIEAADSLHEQAHSALAFFGVPSVDAWRQAYSTTLNAAAYRASSAYEVHPGAEAAWLRQGEIQARAIDCAPWNNEKFLSVLPRVREFTREPNPDVFMPQLEAICAEAGVAIVITRSPEGCRSSGATKFISETKALMLLSFRYLSDDQFWFTVFHEAGHLVLHTEKGLFLEGACLENARAEDEANEFAKHQLFPADRYEELTRLPLNKFAIARFARRVGVSPGLVVGQLQDIGRTPHRHFNYMKVRYSWAD